MDYEAKLEVQPDSQILYVVDVETTGLDPKTDAIVEIGMAEVDIVHETVGGLKSSLIHPGKPIPPEASAIHHITDFHVKKSPLLNEALQHVFYEIGQSDLTFCAHHAEFDQAFLGIKTDMVCTKRLSRHVWTDLESHRLQYLRYHLGLELHETVNPHRARGDVVVTSHILLRLVKQFKLMYPHLTGEGLLKGMCSLSGTPIRLVRVGFGKHKGKAWDDVPTSYLEWLSGQDFDKDVLHTVRSVLNER